jgi:hypothetical protein
LYGSKVGEIDFALLPKGFPDDPAHERFSLKSVQTLDEGLGKQHNNELALTNETSRKRRIHCMKSRRLFLSIAVQQDRMAPVDFS